MIEIFGLIGILMPLNSNIYNDRINLSERFYLGGINSLRGFNTKSIGASSSCRPIKKSSVNDRNYLGGNFIYSGSTSVL